MGKRGPQRTPLKILKSRGSTLASSRENEPKPSTAEPKMPSYLWPDAKPIWRDTVKQLTEMGILGECDKNALGRYCQSMAQYIRCQNILRKRSTYTRKTREGNPVKEDLPQVQRSARLAEECRKIEMLFGLTPASRSSFGGEIGVARIKPQDNRGKKKPKSRFFTGHI